MKKLFAVAVLSAALALGGCLPSSGVDVNAVIAQAKAACGFTPAASGIIALINAASTAGKTQTPTDIAQQICAAVNNVNPPAVGGGTKFAKGTDISVVVDGVTITGVVGK